MPAADGLQTSFRTQEVGSFYIPSHLILELRLLPASALYVHHDRASAVAASRPFLAAPHNSVSSFRFFFFVAICIVGIFRVIWFWALSNNVVYTIDMQDFRMQTENAFASVRYTEV